MKTNNVVLKLFFPFFLCIFLQDVCSLLLQQMFAHSLEHLEWFSAEGAAMVLHGIGNLLGCVWLIFVIQKFSPMSDGKKCGVFSSVGWIALGMVLSFLLNVLFSFVTVSEADTAYATASSLLYSVPTGVGVLLYGVVSPIGEELLFRLYLQRGMRPIVSPVTAIVMSALMFGLFHGNLIQGVYGFLMGCFLGYAYEKTGKWYVPVLCHGAANLLSYLW